MIEPFVVEASVAELLNVIEPAASKAAPDAHSAVPPAALVPVPWLGGGHASGAAGPSRGKCPQREPDRR